MGSSVSHREHTLALVQKLEILIFELLPIDRFSAFTSLWFQKHKENGKNLVVISTSDSFPSGFPEIHGNSM
jgi:hypothetical protein